MKNNLLGNRLFQILEEATNNEVAEAREDDNIVFVTENDIKAILQELITLSSEGLTLKFDGQNINNIDSTVNTIFGLANDLKEKTEKMKEKL